MGYEMNMDQEDVDKKKDEQEVEERKRRGWPDLKLFDY